LIFIASFLFLILVPLVPALLEIIHPRDNLPLLVDYEYTRDPRYFAKSFKRKFIETLSPDILEGAGENADTIRFSDFEVKGLKGEYLSVEKEVKEALLVWGEIRINSLMEMPKEVYAKGNVYIGENSTVNALSSEENIFLEKNSTIIHWVDAAKSIITDGGVNLGGNASCNENLILAKEIKFKRLFASPIATRKLSEVNAIEKGTFIKGSIKSNEDVFISGKVTIEGSVFSEKNIETEGDVEIKGNVFAQGKVILGDKTKIGEKGKVKSVIAKKGLVLKGQVVIYGYAATDGKGIVA